MAKTYNKMWLDVSGGFNDIVTEVQGDQNSRYLDIYLFNNGIPIDLTGHTVRIYMRRPNTNPLEEFFNDGEITEATRGRCQFLLSTQALAKEGELEAQVSIWNGTEEILSTQVFKIMVTKKLRTSGSVESSNEYGALVVLFQNLYEAYDLMTTMVENIGSPSEIAERYNLATMWQAWEFLTDYMKTDLTNKINEAIENAAVQGVLDLIGTTADTGGSETAGTVMAKNNAILNAISKAAGITAQTKAFTEIAKGSITTSDGALITGKGRIILYGTASGYTVTANIKIDGMESESISLYYNVPFALYFEESIEISIGSRTAAYIVQT